MSGERLFPKTHLITSIRNRSGFTLAGAMHEFTDNALGHGQAETVHIAISPQTIVVQDDGIGVDKIDRIFRLADASNSGKLSEIGQYGVGATDSAIFNGDYLHVATVRAGRYHERGVDWAQVEDSGLWPLPYRRRGVPYQDSVDAQEMCPSGQGTRITISKLHRHRHFSAIGPLIDHLGVVFMPALRAGKQIHIHYIDSKGTTTSGSAEPFIPADLTDIDQISGAIEIDGSVMRWRGRVGTSMQLTKKTNAVFFWFAHRVIEATADPFKGASVPTLYAEVELIAEDRWKFALSDHKDQVSRHRAELMESVNVALADRIKEAEQQGHHLALRGVIAPIELKLTKALIARGLLFVDPNEDPEPGGSGEKLGNGGGHGGPHGEQLRTPTPTGTSAKPIEKVTGVTIRYEQNPFENEGMPYTTRLSAQKLEIVLNEQHYRGIFRFPPNARDRAITELIVAMLSRGIESDLREKGLGAGVLQALKPKLRAKIEEWDKAGEVAPRLQAEFIARVAHVDEQEDEATP